MVREDILYDTYLFKILRIDLLPVIWSTLAYVLCALEKNVCAVVVGRSVLYMSIRYKWFIVLSSLFPYLSSVWLFYPLFKSRINIANYYCRTVYFSLLFSQFLLHVFQWSAIRCIIVYNCYILLHWAFINI